MLLALFFQISNFKSVIPPSQAPPASLLPLAGSFVTIPPAGLPAKYCCWLLFGFILPASLFALAGSFSSMSYWVKQTLPLVCPPVEGYRVEFVICANLWPTISLKLSAAGAKALLFFVPLCLGGSRF